LTGRGTQVLGAQTRLLPGTSSTLRGEIKPADKVMATLRSASVLHFLKSQQQFL